ncbi:hypothetical protein [Streptomyces sp. NPDC050560]|uniref:hypothetical protein n=1 Tax=Streptomyces sp. NPDC050560 TaxID=3365630 RepID=UPI00378C8463
MTVPLPKQRINGDSPFERWTGRPDGVGLPGRVVEAAVELATGLGTVDFATLPRP